MGSDAGAAPVKARSRTSRIDVGASGIVIKGFRSGPSPDTAQSMPSLRRRFVRRACRRVEEVRARLEFGVDIGITPARHHGTRPYNNPMERIEKSIDEAWTSSSPAEKIHVKAPDHGEGQQGLLIAIA